MSSGPDIELRHFRFFMAVAETGSFTRAAERLAVTQPAISKQIAQLEGLLGSELFDRNGHRVRLTGAGTQFAMEAREVLRKADAALRAVSDCAGLRGGSLAVGMVPVCNVAFAARLCALMQAAHPDVHLRIEERSALDIESRLERGDLDLGIGFLSHIAPTIDYSHLLASRFRLVVGNTHPLARRRSVTFQEVARLPLALLPTQYHMRNLIDQLFLTQRQRPRVLVENEALITLLHITAEGRTATLLPDFVPLHDVSERLRPVNLRPEPPKMEVGLMRFKATSLSPAAQEFIRLTRQLVK
jgi:LysR family cyn operon transcriptional activator